MFDQAGQQQTVVAVCHRQPEPVFRVTFDDESCLIAGAQQPWVTLCIVAVCHRQPEPVFRVTFDDESCLIAGAQPTVGYLVA